MATLRRERPRVQVATREGTTPSLVRAPRAGTLALALLSSRPQHRSPEADDPPLHTEPLLEDRLVLAVPADGRFADRVGATAQELAEETWIASPSGTGEPGRSASGRASRPVRAHHASRDWLTKLHLVAAGVGVTTVPATRRSASPPGVRLVTVADLPQERRRGSPVWLLAPGP